MPRHAALRFRQGPRIERRSAWGLGVSGDVAGWLYGAGGGAGHAGLLATQEKMGWDSVEQGEGGRWALLRHGSNVDNLQVMCFFSGLGDTPT